MPRRVIVRSLSQGAVGQTDKDTTRMHNYFVTWDSQNKNYSYYPSILG